MLHNSLVSKNRILGFSQGFRSLFFFSFFCFFVCYVLRANSGSNSVREHWFEICKSGLELHPWERSCDISQWPRGNIPYFDAYIFITLRIQDELFMQMHLFAVEL